MKNVVWTVSMIHKSADFNVSCIPDWNSLQTRV